ncbi:MAG TPA: hypothetical protein VEF04_02365 [Blastocatellia bacterium]|nr:hypothetical protein [Blastocatellia bacterium]
MTRRKAINFTLGYAHNGFTVWNRVKEQGYLVGDSHWRRSRRN